MRPGERDIDGMCLNVCRIGHAGNSACGNANAQTHDFPNSSQAPCKRRLTSRSPCWAALQSHLGCEQTFSWKQYEQCD